MDTSAYEILIWISDQHSGAVCGYAGDPVVRTPNLDALAAEGAVFTNAYTSCPVCVPARASFLTCRYPLDIGMTGNTHSFPSHDPTFLHCLSIADYETVLCGRMHFRGLDQRHGFEKRIAKDITTSHWGYVFNGSGLGSSYRGSNVHQIFPAENCASYQYDNYVLKTLLRYLEEPHMRKQAIVVGTYLPHWPLGAPEETIAYYRGKMESTCHDPVLAHPCGALAGVQGFSDGTTPDTTLEERAVYYAMIEEEDRLIGQARTAWRAYLERKGKKGIFIYLSDHGDHMGDKGRFGKETLFELSAHIPMIIQIDGCPHQEIREPVSIMDVGETLCALTGAPRLPFGEGVDLSPAVFGEKPVSHPVIAEILGTGRDGCRPCMGTMVRQDDYKLITYREWEDEDLLFNIVEDPGECRNLVGELPERYTQLKALSTAHAVGEEIKLRRAMECVGPGSNAALLSRYGLFHRELLNETWTLEENKS